MIGYIKNNKEELLASLSLALTFFFFGPISIVISNTEVLDIDVRNIWFFYIFISIFVFLILLLISKIVKPFTPFITILYIALSIGFVIQGYFLDFDLGTLDGNDIIWETYKIQSWIELIIWAVIIGITIIFRRFIRKNIISIVSLLFIFQISSNLITIISNPLPKQKQNNFLDVSNEYNFSTTENVIIIVLDTFRSDIFSTILDTNPEYEEVFKDFTYFKNALGGFPTTRPSIPLMLTGEYYDNSVPIDEFIRDSQDKSLPIILKDHGYKVERYYLGSLYYGSVYDNNLKKAPLNYRIPMAWSQYIATGIRYMPLILKPLFVSQYYQGSDYYHKDMVDFVNQLGTINAEDDQPVFKFIHFTGAHSPYQLDNELNHYNDGYFGQASASLKLVKEFLDELKRVKAYDNSLIIVLGDHGTQGGSIEESSQPLLLAKRIGQQSIEMNLSNSPITIGDIPKTITEELNLTNSYQGYSIFDPIPTNRIRKWFYYIWAHSDWSSNYLPTMYELEIQGPADQMGSYTLVKTITDPTDLDILQSDFQYHFGDNLIETMLSDKVFRELQSYNFSYEESNGQPFSWASAPHACVHLSTEEIEKELLLSLDAKPFLFEGILNDQTMNVFIDGKLISSFTKDSIFTSVIPSTLAMEMTKDNKLDLCFEFPNAKYSPKDFDMNTDIRHLGYSFRSIILSVKNP